MKKILTGIKPTGHPHLGNYIGAIKPAIDMANENSYYFIADYHAMTSIHDKETLKNLTYEVASTWLALGLDYKVATFYKQSAIPQIFELTWILSTLTNKGLMNRAHAYKSAVESNKLSGKDKNNGINMGLFTYPILMASDILIFDAESVPVGKDQIQHVEIARDLAETFNKTYKKIFTIPHARVDQEIATLPGLDGRKMSKSYNNTIPLFSESKKLRKNIMSIVTDSTPVNEPKNPDSNSLFTLYRAFSTKEESELLKNYMLSGVGWGEIKKIVFEKIDYELTEAREKYFYYMNNLKLVDEILEQGNKKAFNEAQKKLELIKETIGII